MRLGVFSLDGHAQVLHSERRARGHLRHERIERLISDVGDAIAHQNVQVWRIGKYGQNFDFALVEAIAAAKRRDAAAESCDERQQDNQPEGKSACALQNSAIVPGLREERQKMTETSAVPTFLAERQKASEYHSYCLPSLKDSLQ